MGFPDASITSKPVALKPSLEGFAVVPWKARANKSSRELSKSSPLLTLSKLSNLPD